MILCARTWHCVAKDGSWAAERFFSTSSKAGAVCRKNKRETQKASLDVLVQACTMDAASLPSSFCRLFAAFVGGIVHGVAACALTNEVAAIAGVAMGGVITRR